MLIPAIGAKRVAVLIPTLTVLLSTYPCLAREAVPTQGKPVGTHGQQLPPAVQQLADQAAAMESKGRVKQAVSMYSRAIALAPQNAALHQKRGEARNKESNFAEALQDFNQALQLDNTLTEAYFSRAWDYDHLSNFAAAVKDYEKYLSFPNIEKRDFAGCCLADNLGQLGQTDRAIKVLNTVILHDPKNAQARRLRGTLLNSATGNAKQAVEDYTVAIEEKVRDYLNIYSLRAGAYIRLKDYAKAAADYSMVLKLSPNDDNACRQRAAAYEAMGDYRKAIEDYSTGIDRNPDWAGPNYFGRARCYKKLGNNVLAQKDLDECKKLDYTGK